MQFPLRRPAAELVNEETSSHISSLLSLDRAGDTFDRGLSSPQCRSNEANFQEQVTGWHAVW